MTTHSETTPRTPSGWYSLDTLLIALDNSHVTFIKDTPPCDRDHNTHASIYSEAAAMLRDLRARCEAAEKDALRYRWLRENSTRMSEPLVVYGQEHLGPVNDEHQCVFQFRAPLIPDFCANPDAAIDAAARPNAKE